MDPEEDNPDEYKKVDFLHRIMKKTYNNPHFINAYNYLLIVVIILTSLWVSLLALLERPPLMNCTKSYCVMDGATLRRPYTASVDDRRTVSVILLMRSIPQELVDE